MARAKATRGRGRPAMQNTSPRRTRARSARARSAAVSAAASVAAPTSAPAAATSAPASAVVSMGAPPPECAIREHFEDAPSLQAVVRDAQEPALPRSQWERDMERRVASSERMLQQIHTMVMALHPAPAAGSPPAALGSAAQVTAGQGPDMPEWGHAFPVQPVEPDHLAQEQPLPFGYGANDNVAPWPTALFFVFLGGGGFGVFPGGPGGLVGSGASVSLPLHARIPDALRAKIWAGEFIDLSLLIKPDDWRSYDQVFRSLRYRAGWAWDSINWELWLKASQTKADQLQPPGSPFPGKGRARTPTASPCFAFNRGDMCNKNTCRWMHKCRVCGGSHPSIRCFSRRAKHQRPGNPTPPGPPAGPSTATGSPAWARKSFFLDDSFLTGDYLQLYTDAAGGIGYGALCGSEWFCGGRISTTGTLGEGQPGGSTLQCVPDRLKESLDKLLQASLAPSSRAHYERAWKKLVTSAQPSIRTLSHVQTAYAVHQPFRSCRTTWSMSCLRPCPPLRPSFYHKDEGQRSPRTGRRILGGGRRKAERSHSEDEPIKYKKIGDSKTLEDDAYILKVIEAYCTSARARQTVNSCEYISSIVHVCVPSVPGR
ncbi:hypothetical protein LSAT2_024887 [Lamellibrachia satsuma]|nr:hypothetical protein LSAT2_024887 [Lamellibrachia satsuma]